MIRKILSNLENNNKSKKQSQKFQEWNQAKNREFNKKKIKWVNK
jgi:hypothetical protein